jgi:ribonucleoside-diphosphate reductase alpha chain
MRTRPPATRKSVTHKSAISTAKDGPVECYITVVLENGSPIEVFIALGKVGQAIHGLAGCWATALSWSLQSGVPLAQIIDAYKFRRFEPSGFTDNPDIPITSSIADYLARWLDMTFLPERVRKETEQIQRRQVHDYENNANA